MRKNKKTNQITIAVISLTIVVFIILCNHSNITKPPNETFTDNYCWRLMMTVLTEHKVNIDYNSQREAFIEPDPLIWHFYTDTYTLNGNNITCRKGSNPNENTTYEYCTGLKVTMQNDTNYTIIKYATLVFDLSRNMTDLREISCSDR